MEATENIKKRVRTSNFSVNERSLIVSLVSKYSHIIENKETNWASTAKKNEAWEKITTELNASLLNNNPRTVYSIRNWYKNRKKAVRQLAADERLSIKKTGGDPPQSKTTEPYDDLLLSIINENTVDDLKNPFDCDTPQLMENIHSETRNNEGNQAIGLVSHNKVDVKQNIKKIQNITDDSDRTETNEHSVESPVLTIPAKRKKFDASRRRPGTVVKALTTSELAEKYMKLVDRRLEIAELQKKLLENAKEEHEENMKLVRMKIRVEEAKLAALKGDNSSLLPVMKLGH